MRFVFVGMVTLSVVACDRSAEEVRFADLPVRTELGRVLVDLPEPDLISSEPETWVLPSDPSLLIGGIGEDELEYTFQEVSDVQLLEDGRVGVVDWRSARVSLFHPTGEFDRYLGRIGDGPGEIRNPVNLRECGGDGLYVLDMGKSVMKVFERDGEARTEFRLYGYDPNQPPYRWECADSSIAVIQWGQWRDQEPGRFRTPVPLTLSGLDGDVRDTLGWIWSPERERFERGAGPAILGSVLGFAMSGRTIYLVEGRSTVVHALSLEGDVRWSLKKEVVADRDVSRDAYIASIRPDSLTPDESRRFEAEWRDREIPSTLPEYRGFLVDDMGRLWIETYPHPGNLDARWSVVDSTGTWLAEVSVPADFTVKDVRANQLAGVLVGAYDVQRPAVFDVVTQPSSR